MRKITALCCVIAVLSVSIFGMQTYLAANRQADAKIDYDFVSFDQIKKDSDLVVKGTVGNRLETIKMDGIGFIVTEIHVKEVFQGDKEKSTIRLLQTLNLRQDPELKADSEVLLFMEKYEGPIINDAYVSKGLYQGMYKVDGEMITPLYDDIDGKLNKAIESNSSFFNKLMQE